jgi:hypothetical protein
VLVVLLVVGSLLCGLLAGYWHATREPTDATTEVALDPVAIQQLFTPPDLERDVAADLQAAATEASAAVPVQGAAEEAAGGEVTLHARALDPETSSIAVTVDAGERYTSGRAAQAAAEAYLRLRADNGVAAADGGIAAVEQNLVALAAERSRLVDVDQLEVHDQVTSDQEASLRQLREGRTRLADEPNGFVSAAVFAADGSSFHETGLTVAGLVLATGLVLLWAYRRWTGPVTRRRGLVGAAAPVDLIADGEDLDAYVRGVLVAGGGVTAPTVVVVPAAAADVDVARVVAVALAERTSVERAVVLVDATGVAGNQRDELLPGPDALAQEARWTVPVGVPLVLDAGAPGPAHEAVVATGRTRRALDGLRGLGDLIVVLAGPGLTRAAVAWSAHADVVAVVVEEDRTLQGEVRVALAALERQELRRPVQVLLVPSSRSEWAATPAAEPSAAG